MDVANCVICKKHQYSTVDSTCRVCKTTKVCENCLKYWECCGKAPVPTREEIQKLKAEIESLKAENQRLRAGIERIKIVALQGINDLDTRDQTQANE